LITLLLLKKQKVSVKVRNIDTSTIVEIPSEFYDPNDTNKHYTIVVDMDALYRIMLKKVIGRNGWYSSRYVYVDYGNPTTKILAKKYFKVTIGDPNNNWSKWVPAKITLLILFI